ncbi:MAG: ferredoxin, partial [Wenzhouxiangella sp.]
HSQHDMNSIQLQVRGEMIARLSQSLLQLTGETGAVAAPTPVTALPPSAETAPKPDAASAGQGDYMPPWIETELCSACDECTGINSRIFAYNAAGKAEIRDPEGGPYSDLVKAAERCKEGIIHPGLPRNADDPALQRWIQRAEPFN